MKTSSRVESCRAHYFVTFSSLYHGFLSVSNVDLHSLPRMFCYVVFASLWWTLRLLLIFQHQNFYLPLYTLRVGHQIFLELLSEQCISLLLIIHNLMLIEYFAVYNLSFVLGLGINSYKVTQWCIRINILSSQLNCYLKGLI